MPMLLWPVGPCCKPERSHQQAGGKYQPGPWVKNTLLAWTSGVTEGQFVWEGERLVLDHFLSLLSKADGLHPD